MEEPWSDRGGTRGQSGLPDGPAQAMTLSPSHPPFCRLPGSDTPAYLENLPASYGFDPLGLGQCSLACARYRAAADGPGYGERRLWLAGACRQAPC